METAAHYQPMPCTLPRANHRRPKPYNAQKVRAHVGSPMRLVSYLTLRRVFADRTVNSFGDHLRDPHPFCARAHIHKSMAEEAPIKAGPDPEVLKDKKESPEESNQKLPPPPEKPLPGDCCGSGCVRCVWDVYYEELEAYNKLCETGSDSKSTAP